MQIGFPPKTDSLPSLSDFRDEEAFEAVGRKDAERFGDVRMERPTSERRDARAGFRYVQNARIETGGASAV
jgi:hypothetical protein